MKVSCFFAQKLTLYFIGVYVLNIDISIVNRYYYYVRDIRLLRHKITILLRKITVHGDLSLHKDTVRHSTSTENGDNGEDC